MQVQVECLSCRAVHHLHHLTMSALIYPLSVSHVVNPPSCFREFEESKLFNLAFLIEASVPIS